MAKKKKAQPKKAARKRAPARPAKAPKSGKWVYFFGDGKAEGKGAERNLLGGKGAGLAEMAGLGLPVPPGFTITTEVCTYYYANGKQISEGSESAGRKGAGADRQADRQGVRRHEKSAAGLGALRRARLDAGHDGYGAQPRPQR